MLSEVANYVTKPFDSRELLARGAALRKSAPARDIPLTWGPIRLDHAARQVFVEETELRLTSTEYAILRLLMANPSQVVTKSLLLEQVTTDTPRLHREFPQDPHEQFAEKAPGNRDGRPHRGGMGYRLQVKRKLIILTKSKLFSEPFS